MKKDKFLLLGKYIFSLLPLILIYLKIDKEELMEAVNKTAIWTLPAVVFIAISLMLIQGLRWGFLI